MKKLFFILFLSLSVLLNASAQTKQLSWGASVTFPAYSYSEASEDALGLISGVAQFIGFAVPLEIRMSKYFALQPELGVNVYTASRTTANVQITVSSRYITIPVLAKGIVPIGEKWSVEMVAGPQGVLGEYTVGPNVRNVQVAFGLQAGAALVWHSEKCSIVWDAVRYSRAFKEVVTPNGAVGQPGALEVRLGVRFSLDGK